MQSLIVEAGSAYSYHYGPKRCSQRVVRGTPVVRGGSPGGPRMFRKKKALQKLYHTLNE
jgi:hypothetical protein